MFPESFCTSWAQCPQHRWSLLFYFNLHVKKINCRLITTAAIYAFHTIINNTFVYVFFFLISGTTFCGSVCWRWLNRVRNTWRRSSMWMSLLKGCFQSFTATTQWPEPSHWGNNVQSKWIKALWGNVWLITSQFPVVWYWILFPLLLHLFRMLGSLASIIPERKNAHHTIRQSLDSHDNVEVEAAIFAAASFSAQSK